MGPAHGSGGYGHPWSHPPEAAAASHSAQPSEAGASALSPNSLQCPHFPPFPLVLLHTTGQKEQGNRNPKPRRAGASVQFSRSAVSMSLKPHGLQHARPPCPPPTPGVYFTGASDMFFLSCPFQEPLKQQLTGYFLMGSAEAFWFRFCFVFFSRIRRLTASDVSRGITPRVTFL